MRRNKVSGGKIVATGSVAAIVPHESYPQYDGAKAAVEMIEYESCLVC
jgi:NAD(P)-dependent dehydrogenase (short-subunit alcohol dehydrogenase family)